MCSVLDRQHIALPAAALAGSTERPCVQGMFAVTEADATEIRAVVEVRRVSPAIEDNVHARESARGIAGYDGVADRTTQGAAVAPRAAASSRAGGSLALPALPRPGGRAIDGGGAAWLMPLTATGERLCPRPALAESRLGDVSWPSFAGREIAAGDTGGAAP